MSDRLTSTFDAQTHPVVLTCRDLDAGAVIGPIGVARATQTSIVDAVSEPGPDLGWASTQIVPATIDLGLTRERGITD